MVLIKWHGHACFEIIDSQGRSVVIDPHDGRSIGIKAPEASADAVLITHDHFDHNAFHVVLKSGGEIHSMKLGKFKILGSYDVEGVEAYHDKLKGRRRGKVVIYKLNVEGVRITHLGDLGSFDEELINALKPTDVLMIPVGGVFTIDANEARDLIRELSPKVAIPMHYWVPGINLPLSTLEDFLNIIEWEVVKLERNEWSVTEEELSLIEPTRVVVFKTP